VFHGDGSPNPKKEAPDLLQLDLTDLVPAPKKDETPGTKIDTKYYTGDIVWGPPVAAFENGTAYTATVTLTAKTGWDFLGLPVNPFTHSGALSVDAGIDSANMATVTIAFPRIGGPKTIELVDKTFTVVSVTPMAAGEIWRENATTIHIYTGSAVETYIPGDANYALLNALLTGLVDTDTVTFDNSSLIDAITKSGLSPVSTITIGTNLPAGAFASTVTLTGNSTNGVKVTGANLTGVTLTLKNNDIIEYDFYGVKVTPNAADATAVNVSGVVTITPSGSGTKISATAATTVDITGLATSSSTVDLTGNVAFTLKVITDSGVYDDTAGTVTGGANVYSYENSDGDQTNISFTVIDDSSFKLTNASGVTTTVTVVTVTTP
jgi:hypothetical protein